MADVQPFCGLRYNVELIKDITAVISPPYDIISQEQQQALYRKSPHNVIRLEYGLASPGDTQTDNRYTRAAALLDEWFKAGILKQDNPYPS